MRERGLFAAQSGRFSGEGMAGAFGELFLKMLRLRSFAYANLGRARGLFPQ
jgi:hypothetical protein